MENYFETDFNVINGPWQRGVKEEQEEQEQEEESESQPESESEWKYLLIRGQIICTHLDSAESNRLKFLGE